MVLTWVMKLFIYDDNSDNNDISDSNIKTLLVRKINTKQIKMFNLSFTSILILPPNYLFPYKQNENHNYAHTHIYILVYL